MTCAVLAAALAAGAWWGIRWSDTRHQIDLTTYLASIPADEWQK